MAVTLGLDLGTSSLKALLVGDDGRPVASASAHLSVERPAFGWSEQNPESWIVACEAVLSELERDHADVLAAVEGIGLSGHMHGATLIDRDDEPLRPCILWNDTRAAKEAAALDDDDARAITGNIVFPGFTAPKLDWVRANEPQIFDSLAAVLLPKDFLRLWLTGERVSEMSDAAGTSWLDTGARDWSDRMLERTHLNRSHMPRLVEGTDNSGELRGEIAERFGLRKGIKVAGGAGDNAASACGVGVSEPGSGFLSLGTSGVLFTPAAGYEPAPETAIHTFCHAIPGLWHQMGVTLSAAGSIEWLSKLLQEKPGDLTGALGEHVSAPGRLTFLPYLSGERTPHNDAEMRGVFAGLEADTGRPAMTRAVMEGVAYSMRDCLEAGAASSRPTRLVAVGAGARSAYWLELMATVLKTEIVLPEAGDFGAALGAARLGLCAATGEDPSSVMTMPPIARRFEPLRDMEESFEEAYGHYRALYPAIAGLRTGRS